MFPLFRMWCGLFTCHGQGILSCVLDESHSMSVNFQLGDLRKMEADVKQCHFQLIQTVLIDRQPNSHYVLTTSHFNYHSMYQSSESGACVMHLTVDS